MWNVNNKREDTFICHIIGRSLTTSLLKGPGSLCSLPALSDMGQRYTPWNEQFAPEKKAAQKETIVSQIPTIHFQVGALSFREGTCKN